jgi:hypothetical protein
MAWSKSKSRTYSQVASKWAFLTSSSISGDGGLRQHSRWAVWNTTHPVCFLSCSWSLMVSSTQRTMYCSTISSSQTLSFGLCIGYFTAWKNSFLENVSSKMGERDTMVALTIGICIGFMLGLIIGIIVLPYLEYWWII